MNLIFNYRTRGDPLDGLRREVYNTKRTLKAMKIWEVNGVDLGVNRLRRRQIRPAPDSGSLFRGPWFDISLSGDNDIDYSDFAFGFSKNAATVTVTGGKVRHGMRTAVVVAGTTKIVTDAVNILWIYVVYIYGSTAVITSSTTEPIDTVAIHNCPLHSWLLVNGTATLQSINHLGDIIIPGVGG